MVVWRHYVRSMAKANGERDEVAEVMQLTCCPSAREEILQEHR